MPITEAFANTEAVGATEWSLPRDAAYSAASPQTDDGVYQLWLDVSDMVTGDELRIRIYEKVRAADTQRIVYQRTLVGPQTESAVVSPSLILLHGWDCSCLTVAGGTIVVNFSIRKVA
jgi:hypothetical protein